MSTPKKTTASKQSSVANTASKKKSTPVKVSTKSIPVPPGREHQLAEQALKLVDEAASVLRHGIRDSAATTAKSRIAAKKKAHDLLGKASVNLTKALEESTSVLQKLIGKL
jgi:hypothetical protein